MTSHSKKAAIARDWIDAWNRHDLEAIMAHYADGVEFRALTVVSRWGRVDGVLRGKAELRGQFARGLALAPNLHFTLERVYYSPNGYAVSYTRENGNRAIDAVELDTRAAAIQVHAYYASDQT